MKLLNNILYVCFVFLHYTLVSSSFSQISIKVSGDEGDATLSKILILDKNINPDSTNIDTFNSPSRFNLLINSSTVNPRTKNFNKILSVIEVVTTRDNEAGSLRTAMILANSNPGPDSIRFNLQKSDPGFKPETNTWTIQPFTELPVIIDDVTIIDATTQPGYNGSPIIELNGSNIDSANGFSILSSNNVIKGFIINGFKFINDPYLTHFDFGTGIWIEGQQNLISNNFIGTDVTGSFKVGNEKVGIVSNDAYNKIENNVISGNRGAGIIINGEGSIVIRNLIGTDVSGTFSIDNHVGIQIYEGNAIVGGLSPDSINIISGNRSHGIRAYTWYNKIIGNFIGTDISGSYAIPNGTGGIDFGSYSSYNIVEKNVISGNGGSAIEHGAFAGTVYGATGHCQIYGNLIGTDATGTRIIENDGYGIEFGFNTQNNLIGNSDEDKRNIISGNRRDGIYIDSGRRHKIRGNFIGTDITGEQNFGNQGCGIRIEWDDVVGLSTEGYYNEMGGDSLNNGNLIRFNGRQGIQIFREALQNLISHNAISQNTEQGIQNRSGGNLELEPPNITGPDSTMEFMPTIFGTSLPEVTIELYIDPNFPHDEGLIFLGSTTSNLNGEWQISTGLRLERGDNFLTATAIDGDNNTSEFSTPFKVLTPAPNISLSDSILNFGEVEVDSISLKHLLIRNNGVENLEINSIYMTDLNSDQFAIIDYNAPFTVSPREEKEIEIAFNPTSIGTKIAQLEIVSNDPDEPSITMILNGTGFIKVPKLEIPLSNINFGNVLLEDSTEVFLPIKNTGTDTLRINDITSSNQQIFLISSTEFKIAPGDSQLVTVTFRPVLEGLYTATMTIFCNDPDNPELILQLEGYGVGEPNITVNPSSFYFGYVALGNSSEVTFNIINTGNDTLEIDRIYSDEPFIPKQFLVSSDKFMVLPDDTQYVMVEYRPIIEGLYEAVLKIECNDSNNPTLEIQVSGNGIVLNPPDNLLASHGPDSTVILKWNIPTLGKQKFGIKNSRFIQISDTVELISYNIYRSDSSPVHLNENNKISNVPEGQSSFEDSHAKVGYKYYYVVTAMYNIGESGTSNETSIIVTHIEPFVEGQIPDTYSLSQNYPNPFNPTTTIEFGLPDKEFVTLKIFNTIGQEKGTLMKENLSAGIYKFRWDANDLPSGMYYYQLKAGEFQDVKKMVLIK
jgi:hypothetical protein